MNETNKLLYSLPDAAAALSVGRTTVYSLVKAGQLTTVKIAGRTLIAAAELNRYVDDLTRRERPSTIAADVS